MNLETANKSSKLINTDQQTNQGEISVSSSSDSSSDEQIDHSQIPQSKNFMLTPEPSCKKSSNLHSFAHSHPGSPSSSSSSSPSSPQQNQLIGIPGYDPNRIPSLIFAYKPTNPMEWSVASSESLFSLQIGNASFSREHGLAATYKMGEIPKVDEPVNRKTDTNLVPPSVKELEKPETAQNLKQKEESESESDDEKEEEEEEEEEELVELDNDNEPEILSQTEKQEDDVDVVNNKSEETEGTCHSTSVSCHSDTSNNSNGSFAFPV